MKGIDCAAPLDAEKAKEFAAAGIEFVCRYLVPERLEWKRLTRAEAEAITAAGMKVVSVYETTATRAKGGRSAGIVDGAEALYEAKIIGQPEGSAIYFAVDYDAQADEMDEIESYLKAAAEVCRGYHVGVYGSYDVVKVMHERGIQYLWSTYAWSNHQIYEHVNIHQYDNGKWLCERAVDLNNSFGGEGWWSYERPVVVESDKPKLKAGDANTIINTWISPAWDMADAQANEYKKSGDETKEKAWRWYADYYHYLADQLRAASGLK